MTPKKIGKLLIILSELLKRKKIFNNKDELIDSMLNFINLKKENNKNEYNKATFFNEKIVVNKILIIIFLML